MFTYVPFKKSVDRRQYRLRRAEKAIIYQSIPVGIITEIYERQKNFSVMMSPDCLDFPDVL